MASLYSPLTHHRVRKSAWIEGLPGDLPLYQQAVDQIESTHEMLDLTEGVPR
jgi:hypothetical protein